ncbi:unnamed protein product [Vitrella brassicaformis CCMP3155]|uniref:Integrase catalytic domain-containing protein n=1 Tax=Vitrella brassicaformis (strain CCMP3155) TaxID=1169540 RepID=A0A0G4FSG6_VITBC|nr:unnamed protein product [Vitrella brassicaformis CCMP3155]|eukprot:CEM17599.1 unnamed protein product [Vitrella brassicaformis CCMP3155]
MKLQGLMTARSLEQLLPTTEAEKDQAPGLWEAGSTEGSLIPTPSASAESGPASTRSPSKEHQALKDPWTWLICGCNGKAQEIVSAAVVEWKGDTEKEGKGALLFYRLASAYASDRKAMKGKSVQDVIDFEMTSIDVQLELARFNKLCARAKALGQDINEHIKIDIMKRAIRKTALEDFIKYLHGQSAGSNWDEFQQVLINYADDHNRENGGNISMTANVKSWSGNQHNGRGRGTSRGRGGHRGVSRGRGGKMGNGRGGFTANGGQTDNGKPLAVVQCDYCQKAHKGGWRHCFILRADEERERVQWPTGWVPPGYRGRGGRGGYQPSRGGSGGSRGRRGGTHVNVAFGECDDSPLFESSYIVEETQDVGMASHAKVEMVDNNESETDIIVETCVAATLSNVKDQRIMHDSASERHCVWDKRYFTNIEPTTKYRIRSVTGQTTTAEGVGTIQMLVRQTDGRELPVRIGNVLYHTIALRMEGNLYYLCAGPIPPSPAKAPPPSANPPAPPLTAATSDKTKEAAIRTHRLCCHVSYDKLAKTQKFVEDMPVIKPPGDKGVCDWCMAGKMRLKNVCKDPGTRAEKPFDLVHLDHKPLPTSIKGHTGFFLLTDDKTRHTTAFTVTSRKKITECVSKYEQVRSEIKTLRSDGAKEFRYGALAKYCRERRIRQQFDAPHKRHQGGVVERRIDIIMSMVRAILADAGMPLAYWPYALEYAVKIHNIVVSKAVQLPDGEITSPHFALYGTKSSIKGLFLFGSAAFVHQRKEKRTALQPKSKVMVMLGVVPNMKGAYRVLDPNTNKVIETAEVTVDETRFPFKERQERMMNPTPAPWVDESGTGRTHGQHGHEGGGDTVCERVGDERLQFNTRVPSLSSSTTPPSPMPTPATNANNTPTPPAPTNTNNTPRPQPIPQTQPQRDGPSSSPPPPPTPPPAVQQPQQQGDQRDRGGGRYNLRRKVQPPKRDEEGYDFSNCGQRQVNAVRADVQKELPTLQEYIKKRTPQLTGSTLARRQQAQRERQEKVNELVREKLG